MSSIRSLWRWIRGLALSRDVSGNVLLITGGSIMMLMLAMGFGVD